MFFLFCGIKHPFKKCLFKIQVSVCYSISVLYCLDKKFTHSNTFFLKNEINLQNGIYENKVNVFIIEPLYKCLETKFTLLNIIALYLF